MQEEFPVEDLSAADPVIDAVLRASRALVAVAARSLAQAAVDVTLPQYRALVLLAAGGPQGVADLANALRVNPSTATRMCDRLVSKRLVRRRTVPGDRRQVSLNLTETGRTLVASVSEARRGEIAEIVGAIPAGRRSQVIGALDAFSAAAGELAEEDWAAGWLL
ncbi:MAG TPA: MarR family transcriptional regulator [Acidimicrobiales bacterium]|nr:MarR family transcriptional regulator [Acidimicrobiales bacterium]